MSDHEEINKLLISVPKCICVCVCVYLCVHDLRQIYITWNIFQDRSSFKNKIHISKLKKSEIKLNIFSEHSYIKLEINNGMKIGKLIDM